MTPRATPSNEAVALTTAVNEFRAAAADPHSSAHFLARVLDTQRSPAFAHLAADVLNALVAPAHPGATRGWLSTLSEAEVASSLQRLDVSARLAKIITQGAGDALADRPSSTPGRHDPAPSVFSRGSASSPHSSPPGTPRSVSGSERAHPTEQALLDLGLEGVVGPVASFDLWEAVRREHLDRTPFQSQSPAITTSALDEWTLAFGDTDAVGEDVKAGREHRTPAQLRQHMADGVRAMGREYDRVTNHDLDALQLLDVEIGCLRMLTGPMGEVYREGLLSRHAHPESPNRFPNTLHLIASGLHKLSRVQPALRLFALVDNHAKFRVPHPLERGVVVPMIALTPHMSVAVGDNEGGQVVELGPGSPHRGACLAWLSYFPAQREVWFPPVTLLEPVRNLRSEGNFAITKVVLTPSPSTHTIQHYIAQRKRLAVEVSRVLEDDWQSKCWTGVLLHAQTSRLEEKPAPWFNVAENFVSALQDVLETRAAVQEGASQEDSLVHAVESQSTAAIERLCTSGARITKVGKRGKCALGVALDANFHRGVDLLLKGSADKSWLDLSAMSLLHDVPAPTHSALLASVITHYGPTVRGLALANVGVRDKEAVVLVQALLQGGLPNLEYLDLRGSRMVWGEAAACLSALATGGHTRLHVLRADSPELDAWLNPSLAEWEARNRPNEAPAEQQCHPSDGKGAQAGEEQGNKAVAAAGVAVERSTGVVITSRLTRLDVGILHGALPFIHSLQLDGTNVPEDHKLTTRCLRVLTTGHTRAPPSAVRRGSVLQQPSLNELEMDADNNGNNGNNSGNNSGNDDSPKRKPGSPPIRKMSSNMRQWSTISGAVDDALWEDMVKCWPESPAVGYHPALTSLQVRAHLIGNDGALTLARAEVLARVESLSLPRNRIGLRGVQALATSVNVSALRELDLAHNADVGPDAGAALANSAKLSLRRLDLSYCSLRSEGVVALAEGPATRSLEFLSVVGNGVGVEGARALANGPSMTSLKELVVGDADLRRDGARAIANGSSLKRLEALSFLRAELRDAGAKALAGGKALSNLTRLVLTGNMIRHTGARAIANGPSMRNLTLLVLSDNFVGAKGAKALANGRSMANLHLLDVSANWVQDKGVAAIRKGKALRSLEVLRADDGLPPIGYDHDHLDHHRNDLDHGQAALQNHHHHHHHDHDHHQDNHDREW